MQKWIFNLMGGAALLMSAAATHAASVVVDAKNNSSSGGTGIGTGFILSLGQLFTVTVDPGDLWNAGDLPRWSNANGLTADLFATGSDDSGESLGTQIGQNWGTYTQGSLTAPFGSLVGQIGGGDFFFIGTSFTGAANAAGELSLFYWDSYNPDNTQSITANVSAVPVPAAFLLLGSALVGMAGFGRRRSA